MNAAMDRLRAYIGLVVILLWAVLVFVIVSGVWCVSMGS